MGSKYNRVKRIKRKNNKNLRKMYEHRRLSRLVAMNNLPDTVRQHPSDFTHSSKPGEMKSQSNLNNQDVSIDNSYENTNNVSNEDLDYYSDMLTKVECNFQEGDNFTDNLNENFKFEPPPEEFINYNISANVDRHFLADESNDENGSAHAKPKNELKHNGYSFSSKKCDYLFQVEYVHHTIDYQYNPILIAKTVHGHKVVMKMMKSRLC